MAAHRLDISDGFKLCSGCEERKPLDDFRRRNGRPNGRMSRCKECVGAYEREHRLKNLPEFAARQREYRQKNPNYGRNLHLMRLYGITIEDFDMMLAEQGGTCAICDGPPMGKGTYHVDHDHATGEIRGLLCHKCNVALGMVQDCSDHLRKLIAYLAKEV